MTWLRKLSTDTPSNDPVSHSNTRDISDRHFGYKLSYTATSQQAPLEVSAIQLGRAHDLENERTAALPAGKAAGSDGIFPEFPEHAEAKVERWILTVLTAIIYNGELPNAFKRYKIVTSLK